MAISKMLPKLAENKSVASDNNYYVKVIATLGPATDPWLADIAPQVDIARIHWAHHSLAEYEDRATAFLDAAKKAGNVHVKIFADMPGLKLRTGEHTKSTTTKPGDTVKFLYEEFGVQDGVIPTQDDFSSSVKVGHPVSMNDGQVWMEVTSAVPEGIVSCRVVSTPGEEKYEIVKNKGLNFPRSTFPDILVERDREIMRQLATSKVVPDYIGLSYTQSPAITAEARTFAQSLGMNNVNFVRKIENREGWKNVEEIIYGGNAGDLSMAALGDMPPELENDRTLLFAVIQDIAKYSDQCGKDWMVCTGLLPSMLKSATASNAEYIALTLIARMGGSLAVSGDELAMNFDHATEVVKTLRSVADYAANSGKHHAPTSNDYK